MIHALISSVVWPPGYYILRDRVPFFLTLVYLYGHKLPYFKKTDLGYELLAFTVLATGIAYKIYLRADDMTSLIGIHWSSPSPIEWGLFITVSTVMLMLRNINVFEAYYVSFISALAGGWLYEFFFLIFTGFDWFVFFKVNAVKVFFVEYQVLCVPILLSLLRYRFEYSCSRLLLPVGVLTAVFYAVKPTIEHFVRQFYMYSYRWYIRIPMIVFLFVLMEGIKGEKQS